MVERFSFRRAIRAHVQFATRTILRLMSLVVLVWFTWPIVELFDTWDKPVDTGFDTQQAIIVVGLCAGYAFISAQQRKSASPLAHLRRTDIASLRLLFLFDPFVRFIFL